MSTIKTETLSTPSNATVSVDTVVNGTAKAWVNFNGTGTVAIRRAFNVSSITDNGTGFWAVNLLTAMPDANYAIAVSAGSPASRDGGAYAPATTNPTTTSFKIRGWGSNAPDTPYDHTYVLAVIFS
jgi:hypothetical protein